MNKIRLMVCVFACFCVTLTLLMLPVQAKAAQNIPFEFSFNDLYDRTTGSVFKEDSEQRWWLSLDSYYAKENRYNTLSASNIFGCRMNRKNYNLHFISAYHTFSNYVSGYPLPYTREVPQNTLVYLGMKKDDASTSSATLHISGRFNP